MVSDHRVAKSEGRIKYISSINRPCQARPTLVNKNSNEPFSYPFTVSVNKCRGNCNAIDDPYAQICVPNKVKSMNLKVANLMSGVNKTRFLVQNESCKCKYWLNENLCNSNQKWSHDKCRCNYRELDDWSYCRKGYMWNPSTMWFW